MNPRGGEVRLTQTALRADRERLPGGDGAASSKRRRLTQSGDDRLTQTVHIAAAHDAYLIFRTCTLADPLYYWLATPTAPHHCARGEQQNRAGTEVLLLDKGEASHVPLKHTRNDSSPQLLAAPGTFGRRSGRCRYGTPNEQAVIRDDPAFPPPPRPQHTPRHRPHCLRLGGWRRDG
eukprot:TRINITY_DN1678_c0_g1_i1.p2 TRINITY_DN1678_c0_g1~~TRINITY_DN1678_c0_g1_i1.p2  ORF type:complete len:177 (-),score=9.77 TRINITY_DN1678_c0_g1_i1:327-857(-)